MNAEARQLIHALGLVPLPLEGGYFRQTWCTSAGTAIYFLMTPEGFSALHRLQTDEVWHFYGGDAVEHTILDPQTRVARVTRLGSLDTSASGPSILPQLVVPGGLWQGARLAAEGGRGWALLGCTMAPAWDQAGFELGDRATLLQEFAGAKVAIELLTRLAPG